MQMTFKIAGNKFRPIEAQSELLALNAGDSIVLEPEPDNKYDANAVKVIVAESQIMIGYVPKDLAANIVEMLNDGLDYTAEILYNGGKHDCQVQLEFTT